MKGQWYKPSSDSNIALDITSGLLKAYQAQGGKVDYTVFSGHAPRIWTTAIRRIGRPGAVDARLRAASAGRGRRGECVTPRIVAEDDVAQVRRPAPRPEGGFDFLRHTAG